ncbi:MAG: AEC family transporter [Azospirillaceae bacterium]
MLLVADIILPVFGIVILGFAAAKAGWFDDAATRGLSLFVFNFALPIMLFRSIATTELPATIEWGFMVSYYAGVFGLYTLNVIVARLVYGRRGDEAAIFGFGSGMSNTVLLGLPLILQAFGERATLPALMIIAVNALFIFPVVTVTIETARGSGAGLYAVVRASAIGLVRNPIILGLAAGIVFNLLTLPIPEPIDGVALLLSGAGLPCALFAMGASLSQFRLAGQIPQAMATVFLKLVAHPLIVFCLTRYVFGLDALWVGVATLMAAMPTGVNVYLFAQRYQICIGSAATTILASTGLSMVTISAVLYALDAMGIR